MGFSMHLILHGGDYNEIEALAESCGTKGKKEIEKLMEIFERGLLRLNKSKEVEAKIKEVEKRTKYLLKKFRDSQK